MMEWLREFWKQHEFGILAGVTVPSLAVLMLALVFWGWWIGAPGGKPVVPTPPATPISPLPVQVLPVSPMIYTPLALDNYSLLSPEKCVGGGSADSDIGGSCERAAMLGAGCRREWGIYRGTCTNGVQTVPCVWGRDEAMLALTNGYIGCDSVWTLGMNECDLAGQCNMMPQEAAVWWYVLTHRFPDRLWASPAPAEDIQWIKDMYYWYTVYFHEAPRFDALDFHCYSYSAERCLQRAAEYTALADQWGIHDIIVSETQVLELDQAQIWLNWLESNDRFLWYAWFCTACREPYYEQLRPSRLINPLTEEVTPFGWAYIQAGR